MNKKGIDERQLLWIFYFILLSVIVLVEIAFINNKVTRTGLDEEYYARDLAFMIDLIEAGNGDVIYKYSINNPEFDFFIGKKDDKNIVIVGKELNDNGGGVESKSYEYNSFNEFGRYGKPNELIIKKAKGKMSINDITATKTINLGSFISDALVDDEFGEYKWVLTELTEDGIIVRKLYVSVSDEASLRAELTSEMINSKLSKFDSFIAASSSKYDVGENLIRAVIWKESNGNPDAENMGSGAIGLMQILPSTAQLSRERLFDPVTNIGAGTAYIKWLGGRFDNDDLILAAYNWGPTNVGNRCSRAFNSCVRVPIETNDYITKVRRFKNDLDIASGNFLQTGGGEAREINSGVTAVLDDEHTVKVVRIDIVDGVKLEVA